MKRYLSSLVMTAALLLSNSDSSAVTFNQSGASGFWLRPTLGDAIDPTLLVSGCPGMSALFSCLPVPYGVGSSVSVDIIGSSVTLTGGVLESDYVQELFPDSEEPLSFAVDATIVLEAGATGTLTGDTIVWATGATYATTGTVVCSNSSGCMGIFGMEDGVPYPADQYLNFINLMVAYPEPVALGSWLLNPAHTSILGSSALLLAYEFPSNQFVPLRPSLTLTFGTPVPEPGFAVLATLGLGLFFVQRARSR